jgi:hypothetical protein
VVILKYIAYNNLCIKIYNKVVCGIVKSMGVIVLPCAGSGFCSVREFGVWVAKLCSSLAPRMNLKRRLSGDNWF